MNQTLETNSKVQMYSVHMKNPPHMTTIVFFFFKLASHQYYKIIPIISPSLSRLSFLLSSYSHFLPSLFSPFLCPFTLHICFCNFCPSVLTLSLSTSVSLLPPVCLHSPSPRPFECFTAPRICAALHGQGALWLISSQIQGNADELHDACRGRVQICWKTRWWYFQMKTPEETSRLWWKFDFTVSWPSSFHCLSHYAQ